MADGKVKLGKEGQLALLAARLGNGGAGKGRNKRLVISEQSERTALKKVTVVEERGIDSLELTIKSGVALLRRGEFGREKGERLPGPLDLLLEDSTNVGIRGIGGEGDRSGGVRMNEQSGGGQGRLDVPKSCPHGGRPGEGTGIAGQGSEGTEDGGGVGHETVVKIN